MRSSIIRVALFAGTSFVLPLAGAQAQTAAPTSPPTPTNPAATAATAPQGPAGSSATTGVGDIVVTARKHAEFQRDVPVSIEAVSGAQLTASKITQLVDLVSRVPTLTVSYGTTSPFAEIRGFGTGNNPSFDQAVGKFIDNVSYGRDQDLRLPLFDIQTLEVLKGPQVLLYGNSATAGALNITTKKPGDSFSLDGSVSYEFNEHEIVDELGVTVPVTSFASLRVAGFYQNLDRGPTYDALTGAHGPTQRNYAGRSQLKLTPSSNLEILLKAEYDHLRSRGPASEAIAQPVAGPPVFPETNADGVNEINNDRAPFFMPTYDGLNNQTYQADINLQALGGTITSTTAYRKEHYTGSVPGDFDVPVFNGWTDYGYKQFSQELRYSGKFGRLDLTVGGFYQHEHYDNITAIDTNLAALGAPVPPFAFNFALNEITKSYSGFADATYHLTDRLSVEAGARYSRVTRDASQAAFPGDIVPDKTFGEGAGGLAPDPALDPLFTGFFGVPPHSFTGLHLSENHLQPQAIVQYKILDKSQVYFKYVKGDKAGGFDANYQGTPGKVSPEQARFLPEQAQSFEVGFKGLILDNKLEFALSAFRTTFTNLQTNAFVGAATVSIVTNVGKARTQGFEAELHYAPFKGLRINATGAYTDAKYLDFPGAGCTRAQIAAQPTGCEQNLSGTSTPFSSKFAGTFGVDYEWRFGNYVLTPGVLVIGRTKYNPSTTGEPLQEQHGYAQLDAHVDLKPSQGIWSLSVFGRNLTNYRYSEFGFQVPLTTGGLGSVFSRGRQIGMRLGFNF